MVRTLGLSSLPLVPRVGARAYAVVDFASGRSLCGARHTAPMAVASLTKITVACTVLRLQQQRFPDLLHEITTISSQASGTIGTSAKLRCGDEVCVLELLYGLLLPSGNDAGMALAEFVGRKLVEEDGEERIPTSPPRRKKKKCGVEEDVKRRRRGWVRVFVKEMEITARDFGATNTTFVNPHGLDVTSYDHLGGPLTHHSTALDVAKTARLAMQTYPLFRSIVSTTSHTGTLRRKNKDGEWGEVEILWDNTHKMLTTHGKKRVGAKECEKVGDTGEETESEDDCEESPSPSPIARSISTAKMKPSPTYYVNGVKTGVTRCAGPCLCTSVVREGGGMKDRQVVVVVLHCKGRDERFTDTMKLAQWAMARMDAEEDRKSGARGKEVLRTCAASLSSPSFQLPTPKPPTTSSHPPPPPRPPSLSSSPRIPFAERGQRRMKRRESGIAKERRVEKGVLLVKPACLESGLGV